MITNYKLRSLLLGAVLLTNVVFLSSCEKDKEEPKGAYEKGVFITNEGNYGRSNAEVSYLNRDTKEVTNGLFAKHNEGNIAGDVIQSMHISGDKAYLIVNNSNKVEVVNANTFKSEGVINNIIEPRYMIVAGSKGYISEWITSNEDSVTGKKRNGNVVVVNLGSNTISKRIPVGIMPENMLLGSDNKLYVTNSNDSTVSIINTASDLVEKTITVGDWPNSIVEDINKNIWVLCGGVNNWKTGTKSNASLVKISSSVSNNVINFPTQGGSKLMINVSKDKMYYQKGGRIFQHDITSAALNTTPLIYKGFYGLGIDPIENMIYGGDAGNYTNNGKVIRYNAQTGAAVDSFEVSIAPNGFVFR